MSVRQTLNEKPAIGYSITVVFVVVAVLLVWWQVMGFGGTSGPPDKYYYTVDDGQTYFVDSADRSTPFDHDGKQAVRAHVFTCSSSGEFVAYLERYPLDRDGKPYKEIPQNVSTEVKRPGEPRWVSHDTDAGGEIVAVTCPGGGVKGIARVYP